MTCNISSNAGTWIFEGELDRNQVPKLLPQLDTLIADVHDHLDVDLSKVGRVDSAGLALLIHLYSHCQQRSIAMTLLEPSEQLLMLMQVSDLDGVIPFRAL